MTIYARVVRGALGFVCPTLARKIVARSAVYGTVLGLQGSRARARVKNTKTALLAFFLTHKEITLTTLATLTRSNEDTDLYRFLGVRVGLGFAVFALGSVSEGESR